MQISVPKETALDEHRVAVTPETVKKYVTLGIDVAVEAGLGERIYISDEAYEKAGATVTPDHKTLMKAGDVILRVQKPTPKDVKYLKEGAIHVSFLDPFLDPDLVKALADHKVNAISMEMIPRITLAQKMDALSSQTSLAGYAAVILGANKTSKVFPMMMTPAGTISPARVFVIGAGVAGLQAIATAKRLGARVDAFDTRPVVKEEVQSLGAKFIEIDLGETSQDQNGYAKALTAEQLAKQQASMVRACITADVVITTAQVFGRKAPLIITEGTLRQMKPGSVVIDMAVATGGNVEGSICGKETMIHDVLVIGHANLPSEVAFHASAMYANNLFNLLSTLWQQKQKEFGLDLENKIIKGCLLTHNGEIINERLKALES